MITRQLLQLDREERTTLLRLAVEGDDSGGPFGTGAEWGNVGTACSIGSSPGDRPIRGRRTRPATTVAIRELLTLLRRLTEQTSRPVNRAAELQATAAWFARCGPTTKPTHSSMPPSGWHPSPISASRLSTPRPTVVSRAGGTSPLSTFRFRYARTAGAPHPEQGKRHDSQGKAGARSRTRAVAEHARSIAASRLVTIDISDFRDRDWRLVRRCSSLDQVLADRAGVDVRHVGPGAQCDVRSIRRIRLPAARSPSGSVALHDCVVRVGAS